MLTRCLHLEHGRPGIRAMGLSPGTVATQMQKEIKASGVNPVSRLEWSDHIPPEWPAVALSWMCSAGVGRASGRGDLAPLPEIRATLGLTA
jgi:NAD(P)-dependent dehydrogenase (short-subunit alcohol dehydrogenase family)